MPEDLKVTQGELDAAHKVFNEDQEGRLLALKAYGERLTRIGFSEAWDKYANGVRAQHSKTTEEVTNEDLH